MPLPPPSYFDHMQPPPFGNLHETSTAPASDVPRLHACRTAVVVNKHVISWQDLERASRIHRAISISCGLPLSWASKPNLAAAKSGIRHAGELPHHHFVPKGDALGDGAREAHVRQMSVGMSVG